MYISCSIRTQMQCRKISSPPKPLVVTANGSLTSDRDRFRRVRIVDVVDGVLVVAVAVMLTLVMVGMVPEVDVEVDVDGGLSEVSCEMQPHMRVVEEWAWGNEAAFVLEDGEASKRQCSCCARAVDPSDRADMEHVCVLPCREFEDGQVCQTASVLSICMESIVPLGCK